MKFGKLRHRVLVEEEQLEPDLDSDGARVPVWLPVFDRLVSARVKALSGREYVAAQAVQSKVTTRITVRFSDKFKARQRITHRTTIYNIEAVMPDEDSGVHYLSLLCSSGVNEG